MPNGKKPTSEDVKEFWNYMCRHYGTTWKYKPNAWEASVAAYFLDLMKIIDKKTFMERYAFILGSTIYLPFKPGEVHEIFSFEHQISACIHEHTHWDDACDLGKFKWNYRYVTSSEQRAIMEARGYRTNMEVYHWYTGKMLDPVEVANTLKNYACSKNDINLAVEFLTRSIKTIQQGGYKSPVTIVGLQKLISMQ